VSFGLDEEDEEVTTTMPQNNNEEQLPPRGMGLVLDHGLDDRQNSHSTNNRCNTFDNSNSTATSNMQDNLQFGGAKP